MSQQYQASMESSSIHILPATQEHREGNMDSNSELLSSTCCHRATFGFSAPAGQLELVTTTSFVPVDLHAFATHLQLSCTLAVSYWANEFDDMAQLGKKRQRTVRRYNDEQRWLIASVELQTGLNKYELKLGKLKLHQPEDIHQVRTAAMVAVAVWLVQHHDVHQPSDTIGQRLWNGLKHASWNIQGNQPSSTRRLLEREYQPSLLMQVFEETCCRIGWEDLWRDTWLIGAYSENVSQHPKANQRRSFLGKVFGRKDMFTRSGKWQKLVESVFQGKLATYTPMQTFRQRAPFVPQRVAETFGEVTHNIDHDDEKLADYFTILRIDNMRSSVTDAKNGKVNIIYNVCNACGVPVSFDAAMVFAVGRLLRMHILHWYSTTSRSSTATSVTTEAQGASFSVKHSTTTITPEAPSDEDHITEQDAGDNSNRNKGPVIHVQNMNDPEAISNGDIDFETDEIGANTNLHTSSSEDHSMKEVNRCINPDGIGLLSTTPECKGLFRSLCAYLQLFLLAVALSDEDHRRLSRPIFKRKGKHSAREVEERALVRLRNKTSMLAFIGSYLETAVTKKLQPNDTDLKASSI